MMLAFAEVIVDDRAEQIRNDAISASSIERRAAVLKAIDQSGSLLRNVVANVAANLVVLALTILAVIGFFSPGPSDI